MSLEQKTELPDGSENSARFRQGLPAVFQAQADGNAYLAPIIASMSRDRGFVQLTEANDLWIRLQSDPVSVVGVNGCQVDAVVELVAGMLRHFNKAVPSRETSLAITKLEEALHWLDARTKDREQRGVEGTNQA